MFVTLLGSATGWEGPMGSVIPPIEGAVLNLEEERPTRVVCGPMEMPPGQEITGELQDRKEKSRSAGNEVPPEDSPALRSSHAS